MKKKAFFVIVALFLGLFSVFAGGFDFAEASSLCTINSFYPSQSNVSSGGSTNLIINTSGCQNLTLSGGTYSNSQIGTNTTFYVGPLYSTTTFFLTGYDYYNNSTNATTIVTVNGNGNGGGSCILNNFYASPAQVSSGGYSTLNWSTNGCTNVNVIGPGINSYSNSDSIQVGPINGASIYTITGSSYSNNINQTVTISNNYSNQQSLPSVITSVPTNINGTSVTFNGNITANTYNCLYDNHSSSNCNNGYTTYYFQYGTSRYSLTEQTPVQTFNNTSGNVSAYVNNLLPYTTYYVQLVITNNFSTNSGGVQQFTTNNSSIITPITAYIDPTPVVVQEPATPIVITRIISDNSNVGGSSAVSLGITGSTMGGGVAGNSINYVVTYQNTSGKTISNATLNVILPSNVIFQQSTQGMTTTNNTVIATLGTLSPNQQGTVNISGLVSNSGIYNNLSATATLAYTNSDGTQDSVVAYANNMISGPQSGYQNDNQNNLTGYAGGTGFFPNTLTEWLAILAVILGIIVAAREFSGSNKPKNNVYVSPNNYNNH